MMVFWKIIVFVVFIIHTIIPFKESYIYIDNYIAFGSPQKFEDIFYEHKSFPEGFYTIGSVSKAEINLYGKEYYEDCVEIFDDTVNDSFFSLLKEGSYDQLSVIDTYFFMLVLGARNNITHFVGTLGAFYQDSGYFNQDMYDYALNSSYKVLQGNIVKFRDELYLVAEISVDNKETIKTDYPIPGYISTVSIFKIDSETANKILLKVDEFKCDSEQMIITSEFDTEWLIREICLLLFVCFFLKKHRGRLA